MQISVSGKNFDVTDALKEYAETRLRKVSRYFDHIITANVTLSTERNWHIADVTVFGKNVDMRGEERSKDMYHSIDAVVEKLERQIKKAKGKVQDRGRQPGREAGPEPAEMEELGHEFFPFHNDENGRINIVYKRDRGYGLIDPRIA